MAVLDFIFITGPSAVGKTTLARELYKRLGGVYIEQNAVPEFTIPPYVLDEGAYEERVCWGCVLRQAEFFKGLGMRNIVILDFDDLRTRELPLVFKGQRFLILRLYSSDPEQLKVQMIRRAKNEGGLFDLTLAERMNQKISRRPLLPNELSIDVAGKTAEQVLEEAYAAAESFGPLTDYDYLPGNINDYYSWVKSRGLN
ncbi:MAG: AAA family ATPase [Ruminococcus sp.]|nr:AAA family ATPase [Ruminococcus sp.]MBR6871941.1 AAA family ATPase [Ruminococcus sp.]